MSDGNGYLATYINLATYIKSLAVFFELCLHLSKNMD